MATAPALPMIRTDLLVDALHLSTHDTNRLPNTAFLGLGLQRLPQRKIGRRGSRGWSAGTEFTKTHPDLTWNRVSVIINCFSMSVLVDTRYCIWVLSRFISKLFEESAVASSRPCSSVFVQLYQLPHCVCDISPH